MRVLALAALRCPEGLWGLLGLWRVWNVPQHIPSSLCHSLSSQPGVLCRLQATGASKPLALCWVKPLCPDCGALAIEGNLILCLFIVLSWYPDGCSQTHLFTLCLLSEELLTQAAGMCFTTLQPFHQEL